jgi:hypothetical protein
MKKVLKFGLIGLGTVFLFFCSYLFIGQAPQPEKINWGVNFSQKQAELLGLDWQETYSALINDLGAKKIKLATYWDLLEPKKDEYYFEDLDQQIEKAEKADVKILLAIGMKTPRWPECHLPEWAKSLNKKEQQKEVSELIEKIISRYQESEAISIWQVENEPFFPFGDCPWVDKNFLEKEINLVKSLDAKDRPVLISDSGEGSLWIAAAKMGDIVGSTMYKKVWFRQLGIYIYYPLPPVFYWRKANLIDKLFGKEVICVELQAEPWGPKLIQDISLAEQEKTMNPERFKENIEFARKTGLDTFYLWGGEWWYWLKEKEQKPEIWQEAQKLF